MYVMRGSILILILMVAGVALCAPYSCNERYQPSVYAKKGRTHVPFDCVAGAPSTCPRSWKAGVTAGRSTASPLTDVDFIKCMEGFSKCGYVPINKRTGAVQGNSGVTIGAGVDLGSKDHDSLTDIGVENSTINQLEQYFGLQGDNAACAAIELPLNLTNDEATALTTAVKNEIVTSVATRYDQQRDSDSLPFSSLPRGVRTAISSVLFQYGSESRVPMFWGYIKRNDWEGAVEELRNFNDAYPTRRNYEADILEAAVAQCNRSIDAVFLLDESGSIDSEDFLQSLNFITEIINIFPSDRIGDENGTRFGMSLFSNSYRSVFYLATYESKTQYLSAIGNIVQVSGGTNLGSALTQINSDQFSQIRGLRPEDQGIPRILIILTDGRSTDLVAIPAELVRNNNIVIYAIGVGNYDREQLNAMASSASHIYTLSSFDNLADFVGTLTAASCHESRPVNLGTKITANVENKSFQYYSFTVDEGQNLKVEVNDTSGRTLVYASHDNPHPFKFDNAFGFTSLSTSHKTIIISPVNNPERKKRQTTSQSGTVYISVTADTESATFVLEGTTCDPAVCSEGTNEVVSTETESTTVVSEGKTCDPTVCSTNEGTNKAVLLKISMVPLMFALVVALSFSRNT